MRAVRGIRDCPTQHPYFVDEELELREELLRVDRGCVRALEADKVDLKPSVAISSRLIVRVSLHILEPQCPPSLNGSNSVHLLRLL